MCIRDSLCICNSMIRFIRCTQTWEFVCMSHPVKMTAIYNCTAKCRTMSIHIFCCGMCYDICTPLEGTAVYRCGKGVIHNKRHAVLVCNVCKFLDENRDICSALLGDNGDINFAQKLRGFIRKKCFNDISAAYNISDVSEFEFLYSYFESGFIGVARYWLQHPETGKSAEDIADIIERIFVFGVKDYIKGEKR